MSILDKIAKIEALIQRASSEGERNAARLAKERVLALLTQQQDQKTKEQRTREQEREEQEPREYKVSTANSWKKRLFVALCSKHGLRTYRYYRQKHTNTCVRVAKTFMDKILWPEFQQYARLLEELVEEILKELITKIHAPEEEEVIVTAELDHSKPSL